jgi:serine/threonine protein kinase
MRQAWRPALTVTVQLCSFRFAENPGAIALSSPNAQCAVLLCIAPHMSGERRESARTGAIMRASMSLSPGAKLGPYEIQAPVGAGGMGEVYRARDTRLERTVAIKVLPDHLSCNSDSKQRFEREARTISSLNHPHICALYDVGTQDGVDFLVMECLEGQTLADRLQRGALPIEQVLKVGIEIADALEEAHRHGVIHRDLKPDNIMLTKSGAKLMDFGLAKPAQAAFITGATLSNRLTVQGTIVGTFQYMAPEQLEGKDADVRSDIFAFGALLYEMATGKSAFSGKSKATLIAAILSSEPPSICSLQPVTRRALEGVVRTCLAKDPGRRFWCAHDLKLQLEWIQHAIPEATEPSVASRRIERLVWAIACAVLLISAVVLYFIRPAVQARPIRFRVPPPEKAGCHRSGGA